MLAIACNEGEGEGGRGRTVYPVGKHDADGDHDLEHACDTATDVLGGAFGDVGGCDGGDGTDAYTCDDSSAVDVPDASASTCDSL